MNKDEFEEQFDKAKQTYGEAKAKFYTKPIFAAQVGIVVGILGTLFVQWVF